MADRLTNISEAVAIAAASHACSEEHQFMTAYRVVQDEVDEASLHSLAPPLPGPFNFWFNNEETCRIRTRLEPDEVLLLLNDLGLNPDAFPYAQRSKLNNRDRFDLFAL
jgi:hypothetical protein